MAKQPHTVLKYKPNCGLDKQVSNIIHSKCLDFRPHSRVAESKSLFPLLRLPPTKHNAPSTLQPLSITIDYMVFAPLRAKGQGVILCLKT